MRRAVGLFSLVFYRGRNNTNANQGLFYWNSNNVSNSNNNIGSWILSETENLI